MTRTIASLVVSIALLTSGASADEIKVVPGPGAISAAMAQAKAGDTVKIAAGDYLESVNVGEGVTLEGAGADATTITGTGYAVINCRDKNRIVGVTIKGGEQTVRGIHTSFSVRVERCRFVGVQEAVALSQAPLSDVIACEFTHCGIGVRAIGGACPTVWGCRFKGGRIGVFVMGGGPYIRNNLFESEKTGIMVVVGHEMAILRNNVFVRCTTSGIEVSSGKTAFLGPSIRNSIFDGCAVAITITQGLADHTSHALVHGVPAPPFRGDGGTETFLAAGQRGIAEGDAGITIAENGSLVIAHPELLEGKGLRLGTEKDDATGTIGLEKEWLLTGASGTGALPPARFGGPRLIANAVSEEYQHLRGNGISKQSLGFMDGVAVDRIELEVGGRELVFDISRFFSEQGMKP